MKIHDLLLEAPLPADWDKDVFNANVPIKTRIEYAKARAIQVGRGSSRTAFVIPYKGRKTVLKVASHNAKGFAQNKAEAELFDDWYIEKLGITIPMFDYDERNGNKPVWVHVEFAEKITQSKLSSFFGGISMQRIIATIEAESTGRGAPLSPEEYEKLEDNESYDSLRDLLINYNGVIHGGDLTRAANWGLYKGRPVIIDLGLTNETKYLYGQ